MPGQPIQSVIFDMDNTLFDFVEAQLSACRAVLLHLGIDDGADSLFRYFLRPVHGFENHDNIRDFLIDNGAFSVRTFAECCAIYEAGKVAAIKPYPGVAGILESLSAAGIRLCIVTDALDRNAVKRLYRAGLAPFFSPVITPDLSGAAKPDPASFMLALERTGIPARSTILVGDSLRRDIMPGKILGMVTVYAQYGDRFGLTGEPPYMPDYFARNVAELQTVLSRLTGSRRR